MFRRVHARAHDHHHRQNTLIVNRHRPLLTALLARAVLARADRARTWAAISARHRRHAVDVRLGLRRRRAAPTRAGNADRPALPLARSRGPGDAKHAGLRWTSFRPYFLGALFSPSSTSRARCLSAPARTTFFCSRCSAACTQASPCLLMVRASPASVGARGSAPAELACLDSRQALAGDLARPMRGAPQAQRKASSFSQQCGDFSPGISLARHPAFGAASQATRSSRVQYRPRRYILRAPTSRKPSCRHRQREAKECRRGWR